MIEFTKKDIFYAEISAKLQRNRWQAEAITHIMFGGLNKANWVTR